MELTKIINAGEKHLTGSDLEFFKRVWSTDMAKYAIRLENIGFTKGERILDAGCGTGQWSVAMSEGYKEVIGVDVHKGRVDSLNDIAGILQKPNLKGYVSGIEELNFPEQHFDAIFCYSVIFFTDISKSIAAFSKVIKRGGRVYINANGIGWYLHNLINTHNSSANFDSRQMAIDTVKNSLDWYSSSKKFNGQVVISSEFMTAVLKKNGFRIIDCKGDGKINLENKNQNISFYQDNYFGEEGVYEILAEKV